MHAFSVRPEGVSTLPMMEKPWYTQPLVWLIIALPASAVIGGFITLGLAIQSDDGLVEDDYYKQGKAINRVLARDRAAVERQLRGELSIDADAGLVSLRLTSGDTAGSMPANPMHLQLLHATRGGFDQQIELLPDRAGLLRGKLPALRPGHWYLQLGASDWRIVGDMHWPGTEHVTLAPSGTVVTVPDADVHGR